MSVNYTAEMAEYLNQTVSWEKATGTDDEAQSTYATAVNVAARKIGKTRRTLNAQGEIITTSIYVLTQALVSVGDMIDGEIVKDTLDSRDEYGTLIGMECFI